MLQPLEPYVYLPSRNPYWQKLKVLSPSSSVLLDFDSESLKKCTFFFEQKVHLEIGCNTGPVLMARALVNPNEKFIGLDWKPKAIYRAYEKSQHLENILWVRARAERLKEIFPSQSLDSIHILFPDPWNKKSQQKNRYGDETFFKEVAAILKSDGQLCVRSDHQDYFEYMLQSAKPYFTLLSLTRDRHKEQDIVLEYPNVSLFEKLFIKDGLPIMEFRALPNVVVKPLALDMGI